MLMQSATGILSLRSRLADLYLLSGSVQFGKFKLAAHEAQPNLPLTPMYMHYPKLNETGSEYLPEMYVLIGELFSDIVTRHDIEFSTICAVPNGADPLSVELASHLAPRNISILSFQKQIDNNGKRKFSGPTHGQIKKGNSILVLDDHTSGGYTKSLFISYLASLGGNVNTVLTVIDREQGGASFLKHNDITLRNIFTISWLLDYYVHTGKVSAELATNVTQYIKSNQITL